MSILIDLIGSSIVVASLILLVFQAQMFMGQAQFQAMSLDHNYAYAMVYRTTIKNEIGLIGFNTNTPLLGASKDSLSYVTHKVHDGLYYSNTSSDDIDRQDRKIVDLLFLKETGDRFGRFVRNVEFDGRDLNSHNPIREDFQFVGVEDFEFTYYDAKGNQLFVEPSTGRLSDDDLVRANFVGFKSIITSEDPQYDSDGDEVTNFVHIEERILLKNVYDFGSFSQN